MHSEYITLLRIETSLSNSIETPWKKLKVGESDRAVRFQSHNRIDEFFDLAKACRRRFSDPPRRFSGVVVSPVMSWRFSSSQTLFETKQKPSSTTQLTIPHFVSLSHFTKPRGRDGFSGTGIPVIGGNLSGWIWNGTGWIYFENVCILELKTGLKTCYSPKSMKSQELRRKKTVERQIIHSKTKINKKSLSLLKQSTWIMEWNSKSFHFHCFE